MINHFIVERPIKTFRGAEENAYSWVYRFNELRYLARKRIEASENDATTATIVWDSERIALWQPAFKPNNPHILTEFTSANIEFLAKIFGSGSWITKSRKYITPSSRVYLGMDKIQLTTSTTPVICLPFKRVFIGAPTPIETKTIWEENW